MELQTPGPCHRLHLRSPWSCAVLPPLCPPASALGSVVVVARTQASGAGEAPTLRGHPEEGVPMAAQELQPRQPGLQPSPPLGALGSISTYSPLSHMSRGWQVRQVHTEPHLCPPEPAASAASPPPSSQVPGTQLSATLGSCGPSAVALGSAITSLRVQHHLLPWHPVFSQLQPWTLCLFAQHPDAQHPSQTLH